MKYVVSTILVIVGLINLFPVIGVVSVETLARLYGYAPEGVDAEILMRHRAVLFGLLGAGIIASAFKPAFQLPACIAGLVSMLAFIALALAAGEYGDALNKAVVADAIGSFGLIIVLAILALTRSRRSE